jgi:hypothetical protein
MPKPLPLKDRDYFGIWDDFYWFISPHEWTKTVTDVAGGAGIVPADGAGGLLTVGTEDSTDEDEVLLESTQEIFLFAANKPIVYETRAKHVEVNTDDANIFYGLMNAAGADAMVDAGGGPKSSFSGFGFYKVDGGTRWQAIASVGTGRTTVDLTAALSINGVAQTVDTSFHVFRIEFMPYNSTNAKVDFFIDEAHVASIDLVYTSATEMQVVAVVKNGGANPEVATIDYIGCFQKR